jgi:hypothetical protein
MKNKLDKLRDRGVVRDDLNVIWDLIYALWMWQSYPNRVFVDVGGDTRNGPYLHVTRGDALRLEGEGYRVLHIHPKELALLHDSRRAAGYGIRWGGIITPMHALLPLAVWAGVVADGTRAGDLLRVDPVRRARLSGAKRVMFDELVGLAKLWTYASRRLEPEYGWGAADELHEDARAKAEAWTDLQLIDYVNVRQKSLAGGLRLSAALVDQGRNNTKEAALANRQFGEATDERIRSMAQKYMKTGRNWMKKETAAANIARDLGKPGKHSYILKRLSAMYPAAAWPPKPRKSAAV